MRRNPNDCSPTALDRLAAVRPRYCARLPLDAGRDPAAVTLVAVSKTFGAEAIEPVIAAGQRVFGENRVQEAKAKWPALRERYPGDRAASDRPAAIQQGARGGGAVRCHSFLRSAEPGEALAKEIARQGRAPLLFVEINTGGEPQKAGVLPEDADAFLGCREKYGLTIAGLMCLPPADEPPAPHFALTAKIARAQWIESAFDGDERRLSDRDRLGCDPCAGRNGDFWRAG